MTDEQIFALVRKHEHELTETYTRVFYEDEWQETRVCPQGMLKFARALLDADIKAPSNQ